MERAALGVDIGGYGSATLLTESRRIFHCRFDNTTRRERFLWAWNVGLHYDVQAFVEKVGARQGEGGPKAHSFGMRHGEALMMLEAANIPWRYIEDPKQWQYEFNLVGDWKSTSEKKNHHKARAKEELGLDLIHCLCDSSLIALYGHRVLFGGLTGGKIFGEIRPGSGVVRVVEHDGSGRPVGNTSDRPGR